MPSIQEHQEKYTRDLAFAKSLDMTDYLDWEIVGYFYAILHKVHIYLHIQGVTDMDLVSHDSTRDYVAKYIPQIECDYKTLLSASHTARYKEQRRTTSDLLTTVKDTFRSLDSQLTKLIADSIQT